MKYDVKELNKVVTMLKGLDNVEMMLDGHSRLVIQFTNPMTDDTTEVTLYPIHRDGKSLNADIKTTKKL